MEFNQKATVNGIITLLVLCFSTTVFAVGGTVTSVAAGGNWNATGTWTAININRTGSVTAATNSTAVTGSGTSFTTELSVGSIITTQTGTAIGTVASITDNTHLTLTVNSSNNVSGLSYRTTGGTPSPDDDISIAANASITANVNAQCKSISWVAGALTASRTLTVSSGITLTVTNAITYKLPAANFNLTVTVQGTLNAGSISMPSTGGNTQDCVLSIGASGIVDISGDLIMAGTFVRNHIDMTTTAEIRVGGDIGATANPVAGGGGFTAPPATSTVKLHGTAAQKVYLGGNGGSTTFGNIIVSNTAGVTSASAIIVAGDLTIENGASLTMGANLLTLQGDLINNGGTTSGSGGVTIAGTATQSIGSFTTTGTVSMTKTAGVATLGGAMTAGALTINGTGGTLNLGAGLTHDISGAWTRTAGTLNGGSSTLKIGGSVSGTGGTFTANTGTIEWDGAAQTIAGVVYNNLTLAGSGTKTTATVTVNGILSITAAIGTLSASPTYGTNAVLQYNHAGSRTMSLEWPAAITASTLGGGIIINSGTVTLNGAKTVVNVPLTVKAGATLALSTNALGSTTGPSSLTLECGATAGSLISGSGVLTLSGNVAVNDAATGAVGATISCPIALTNLTTRTFTVADDGTTADDLTVSGLISTTGALTKSGLGTMVLSNTSSSYTGVTTVSLGTLKLGNAGTAPNGPLGTTGGGTTVSNGGTLDLNGFTLATTEALTLNGTGTSGSGALANSSNTGVTFSGAITSQTSSSIVSTGNIILSGAISIANGLTLTLGGTSANSNLNGVINNAATSTASLLKQGSGTWTIQSGNTNKYSGGTTIEAGTLIVNSLVTTTNLGTGGITLSGGILQYNGTNQSTAQAVVLTASTSSTINVNDVNTTLTISNAITGGGGLIKTGAGTLAFGSTVTASAITVSGGTLNPGNGTINVSGNFDASNGAISGNSFSATLVFNGTGVQSFNPGTGITYTAVQINNTSAAVSLTAAASITTLTVAANAIFSDNGNQITGTGTLTVNGTLELGGTNNTTFPTTFGSVVLGASSTIDYASNNVSAQTITARQYVNLTSSGSGPRNMAAGNINISGTFTPGSNVYTFADASSTIDYNGTGAQSIASFDYYNNLTISGSRGGATVTLGSSITIGGDFSPSATLVSYTTTGSTVTFSGSAFQNINNPFNFNSLTINATAPVLLNADISTSATGTLTLSAGHLVLNGNTYTINGTSLVSGGGDIDATMVTPSTIKCSHTGILTLPYDAVSAGMWNLTVDQGGTVDLSGLTIQTFSIGGVLSLTNNSKIELLNDTKLQLDGSVSMGSGASPTGFIKGNPQARMTIAGSGLAGNVGTLYFDPATDRSTNSINEFVIATASGGRSVTLGNKLNIITLFTPLNDIDPLKNVFTFNSKGFLTMRSSSKWTASVNRVGSGFTFADSVVVERYVTGKTVRRYISVGPPVNGATIRTAWQDSIFITAPGNGGTICGSTSGNGGTTDKYNSNGYDATTANLYTIQSYEQSGVNAGAFQNIGTNTTTTTLTSGKGYKVLYRGPRFKNSDGSSNCTALLNTGGTGIVADTVTMTAKAFLTTGDVTVSLNSKPTASSYGYTFLSNPYACQLDFSQFYANNTASGMNQGFWINDPNGYSNGYVTIKYTGSWVMVGKNPSSPNFTTSASELPYIASGQAFFVSTANTSNLAVTFKEDYKVIPTVQQIGAFRSSGTQSMVDDNRIRAYFLNADSSYIDDVLVLFSDDPTVSKNFDDKFDAVSLNSGTFLTTVKGTKACAIQTRPIGFYNDTVAMRIVSASTGNFLFNFTEYQNFDSADQIILLDLYNNTQTDVKSNPYFNFSITSDAATQGANRFKLVFRSQASVLPVSFLGISATQKQTGVEVAWRLAFEQNIQSYNVQRSDNGRDFYSLSSVKSKGNSSAPVEYTYMDQKPVSAVAYYRIKSIDVAGEEKYSAVVKINSSKESLISLYPNPVKDQLKVVTANLSLDKATAEIRNVQGKMVFQRVLRGSNGNYSIDVSNLASGLYILTITTGDGNRMMEKFMKY